MVFDNLANQAAAYNRDMHLPIETVAFTLLIFIWILIIAQAIFTRINRLVGYVLFNLNIAVMFFFGATSIALFLKALNTELPYTARSRIITTGGLLIGAVWLLWMVITLLRRKHANSFTWRILATNKLVAADPARMQAAQTEPLYSEPSEDMA